ncbi:hypothetical protein [Flavobacterium chungnamense]
MKKINYLQIIIHFIAACIFMISATTYSRLYNIKILKLIYQNGFKNVVNDFDNYGITPNDIAYFTISTNISSFIGLTIAFLFSILLSLKKKWSIINSFIVFLLGFLVLKLDILDKLYLRKFVTPNHLLDNLVANYLLCGTLLLFLGCTLFFSRYLNDKISSSYFKT